MHPCHRLTARERDVLALVAKGKRNRQIADMLSITEGTVEVHLHNIFQKLDVSTRTEAALLYTISKGIAHASFLNGGIPNGDGDSMSGEVAHPRSMVE